jgi:hypothetical protein
MGIRSQNNPLAAYLDVFSNTGTDAAGPTVSPNFGAPQGLTATGGVISEYVDGDEVYRAHVFTASGTFAVTDSTSDFPLSSKVLIVAGGGGGGGGPNWAGGGGAGGLLEATAFTLAQRSYPIVIGSGGGGGVTNSNQGGDGVNTVFTDPGGPTAYTAVGGGGGGAGNSPKDGRAGGSGGGSADNDPTFGPSTQNPISPFFTGYGNVGGGPGGANGSSGGGGAGSPSTRSVSDKYPGTRYVTGTTSAPTDSPSVIGHRGRANTFAYGPANSQVYAGGGGGGFFDWDGPGGPNAGAGVLNPTNSITDMNSAPANGGGGGKGGSYYQGIPITERSGSPGTGGGGGGGIETGPRSPQHPNAPQPAVGGNGGGGTVVVAYQIGRITAAAKASGGAISFTPTHTIHTFTSAGQFVIPGSYPSTPVQILAVAGGGSGGPRHGGGGGAGGLITLPGSNGTLANGTYNVLIGAGGPGGNGSVNGSVGGNTSFGPPASAAAPTHLLALGGGAGMKYPGHTGTNSGGSSGGMGGEPGSQAGSAAQPNPSVYGTSTGHGNAGNTGTNWAGDYRLGGGGGGAGGAGIDGGPSGPQTGNGGVGLQVQIAPNGSNLYYAGGGGGGIWGGSGNHPGRHGGAGGLGGGGGGSSSNTGTVVPAGTNDGAGAGGGSALNAGGDGTQGYLNIGGAGGTNTGGGGGGNGQSNYSSWPITSRGGNGGSGIVIIAYPT